MLFPSVPGMAQFHDPRVPQKNAGIFVKSQKIQRAFSLQVSPEKINNLIYFPLYWLFNGDPYAGLWLETPHNRVVSFHIRP